MLEARDNIPATDQTLSYRGQKLLHNNTLGSYGIIADSELQLELEVEEHDERDDGLPDFFVSVWTVRGEELKINITPSFKVEDLKLLIQDRLKVLCSQQRIIFRGKQLKDARKLDDCGVEHSSSLDLVLRLRGC